MRGRITLFALVLLIRTSSFIERRDENKKGKKGALREKETLFDVFLYPRTHTA